MCLCDNDLELDFFFCVFLCILRPEANRKSNLHGHVCPFCPVWIPIWPISLSLSSILSQNRHIWVLCVSFFLSRHSFVKHVVLRMTSHKSRRWNSWHHDILWYVFCSSIYWWTGSKQFTQMKLLAPLYPLVRIL